MLSLFAGIGGFDLAAEWAGIETAAQVEIDGYCRKILKKNFPQAIQYGDIKQFGRKDLSTAIDIICGGFPCQPYSAAGLRKGKEDARHLWPEMLRIVREFRPRWVLGENVYGLITWSEGMVFDQVHLDLEAEGYQVQSIVLPAAATDAPHRRDRIWIIAYANGIRGQKWPSSINQRQTGEKIGADIQSKISGYNLQYDATNANGLRGRQDYREGKTGQHHKAHQNIAVHPNGSRCKKPALRHKPGCAKVNSGRRYEARVFEGFPTQSPVLGRNDGISNRVDRIRALGNAIVPQVAYQIFKTIKEFEALETKRSTH